VIVVNTRLRDALNKRQKSYAVIEGIADIFRDNVPDFAPFVSYGVHQLYGKYEFEKEKRSNPAFAQFVEVRPRVDPTYMFDIMGEGLGNRAEAGFAEIGTSGVFDKTDYETRAIPAAPRSRAEANLGRVLG
jgi:hypothetical protein